MQASENYVRLRSAGFDKPYDLPLTIVQSGFQQVSAGFEQTDIPACSYFGSVVLTGLHSLAQRII